MRFKERVVLVTGACRYTGHAIAAGFCREGATVWVNGRSREAAEKACSCINKEGTVGTAIPAPADLSEPTAIAALFQTIAEKNDRLDVLVNNAVDQSIGTPFLEMDLDRLEAAFRVNVFALFACSQEAARLMISSGGGAIVNVGSNVSTRAIRSRSAYVASKGAVDALTNAMVLELGPHGIRVNTVAPGYIHTGRWDDLSPELAARRRQNIPLGQELSMDEVAEAALFLASDASRGISGARLVMDGGCSSQHMPPDADC